ncbi:MAG: hypothetical protein R3B72_36020 [Polyangiaceae bacterium]
MYTLIRTLPPRRFALEQLPTLGGALIVAETFYKFHSFVLECAAFLATWFVLDFALSLLLRAIGGERRDPRTD